MASVCTIYRATCLANGKCYVGFDSNWPARKSRHEYDAKIGAQYKFHRAIRKHGWESFEWEIIYQSRDREHCLHVMEPHFIAEFGGYTDRGYNLTSGGEGALGRKLSDEARARISSGLARHAVSPEARAKMSAAKKGHDKSPETRAKLSAANKGRHISPEHRAKLIAANKGRIVTEETRAKISATKKSLKASTHSSKPLRFGANDICTSPRR